MESIMQSRARVVGMMILPPSAEKQQRRDKVRDSALDIIDQATALQINIGSGAGSEVMELLARLQRTARGLLTGNQVATKNPAALAPDYRQDLQALLERVTDLLVESVVDMDALADADLVQLATALTCGGERIRNYLTVAAIERQVAARALAQSTTEASK